jgi:hypothetical protein
LHGYELCVCNYVKLIGATCIHIAVDYICKLGSNKSWKYIYNKLVSYQTTKTFHYVLLFVALLCGRVYNHMEIVSQNDLFYLSTKVT